MSGFLQGKAAKRKVGRKTAITVLVIWSVVIALSIIASEYVRALCDRWRTLSPQQIRTMSAVEIARALLSRHCLPSNYERLIGVGKMKELRRAIVDELVILKRSQSGGIYSRRNAFKEARACSLYFIVLEDACEEGMLKIGIKDGLQIAGCITDENRRRRFAERWREGLAVLLLKRWEKNEPLIAYCDDGLERARQEVNKLWEQMGKIHGSNRK